MTRDQWLCRFKIPASQLKFRVLLKGHLNSKLLVASVAKPYCMPTAPFVNNRFLYFHINVLPESIDLWLTTPFISICIHRSNCWATNFPHHMKKILTSNIFVLLFIKKTEHIMLCCVESLSHVWLFVTPLTVACQAPLSIDFSNQEYWSG